MTTRRRGASIGSRRPRSVTEHDDAKGSQGKWGHQDRRSGFPGATSWGCLGTVRDSRESCLGCNTSDCCCDDKTGRGSSCSAGNDALGRHCSATNGGCNHHLRGSCHCCTPTLTASSKNRGNCTLGSACTSAHCPRSCSDWRGGR